MAEIQRSVASSAVLVKGTRNALTDSRPLGEANTFKGLSPGHSGRPSTTTSSDFSSQQRVQLAEALLAIGHLPGALYFLGQYPWLAQHSPKIADLIIRMIEAGIGQVTSRLSGNRHNTYNPLSELSSTLRETPLQEIVPSLAYPVPPSTPTTKFTFFYPDWHSSMERWSGIGDITSKGLRWLSLLGGIAGKYVNTMAKLSQIGAQHFEALREEKALHRVEEEKGGRGSVGINNPVCCLVSANSVRQGLRGELLIM